MAKGYWVVQSDIGDPHEHQRYLDASRTILQRYGARMLVRSERREIVEGTARARQLVIEFPDYDSAVACYHSDEYRKARRWAKGRHPPRLLDY